jgi:hypothetical protein
MVAVRELLSHQPVRTVLDGLLVRLLRRALPSGNGTAARRAVRETSAVEARRVAAVADTRAPAAAGAFAHRSVQSDDPTGVPG